MRNHCTQNTNNNKTNNDMVMTVSNFFPLYHKASILIVAFVAHAVMRMTAGASRIIRQPLFFIPLYPQPFKGLLPNPNPVHSDILSSYLFFCLPFLLPPSTKLSSLIFASPLDLLCAHSISIRLFSVVIRSSYGPIACLVVFLTSFVT